MAASIRGLTRLGGRTVIDGGMGLLNRFASGASKNDARACVSDASRPLAKPHGLTSRRGCTRFGVVPIPAPLIWTNLDHSYPFYECWHGLCIGPLSVADVEGTLELDRGKFSPLPAGHNGFTPRWRDCGQCRRPGEADGVLRISGRAPRQCTLPGRCPARVLPVCGWVGALSSLSRPGGTQCSSRASSETPASGRYRPGLDVRVVVAGCTHACEPSSSRATEPVSRDLTHDRVSDST